MSDYKCVRLNDLVNASVSSVIVIKARIMWNRTTTNGYYLGEHTHIVDGHGSTDGTT